GRRHACRHPGPGRCVGRLLADRDRYRVGASRAGRPDQVRDKDAPGWLATPAGRWGTTPADRRMTTWLERVVRSHFQGVGPPAGGKGGRRPAETRQAGRWGETASVAGCPRKVA